MLSDVWLTLAGIWHRDSKLPASSSSSPSEPSSSSASSCGISCHTLPALRITNAVCFSFLSLLCFILNKLLSSLSFLSYFLSSCPLFCHVLSLLPFLAAPFQSVFLVSSSLYRSFVLFTFIGTFLFYLLVNFTSSFLISSPLSFLISLLSRLLFHFFFVFS